MNPAKSKIGKFSKKHLDINKGIRQSTELPQWRSTASVLQWFKGITDKQQCRFLKFDIVDFYLSILERLLRKAIKFAKTFVPISHSTWKAIMHCRKSFLFSEDSAWVKKDHPLFDVAMGAYDGAEICELVGLYFVGQIVAHHGKVQHWAVSRWWCLRNTAGRDAERLRKKTSNQSLRKWMLLNAKCLFYGAMSKFFIMIVHYSDHNNDFIVDVIWTEQNKYILVARWPTRYVNDEIHTIQRKKNARNATGKLRMDLAVIESSNHPVSIRAILKNLIIASGWMSKLKRATTFSMRNESAYQ